MAPECHAQGAHVGQDDLSVAEARKLAGEDAIIGKSTHSLVQARAALQEKPDYIGFGPLFATPTKPDYTPIGIDDIRRLQDEVTIPVFCIGGINRGIFAKSWQQVRVEWSLFPAFCKPTTRKPIARNAGIF